MNEHDRPTERMIQVPTNFAPTERKIASVANGLAMGANEGDIRSDLINEGYSEYAAFLTIKAAETYNRMRG